MSSNAASVRIKICGLTRLQDALEACRAGADALGFNFCDRSPRRVTLGQAAEIVRRLPPFVARVGVFADPPQALVLEALSVLRLDWLQFHGAEDPEFVFGFPASMVIKALSLGSRSDLSRLRIFSRASGILLDAGAGGTGRTFDWNLAREARRRVKVPLILAGGLHPGNVAEAVRAVRPWAVDVASGVERAPGIKDRAKMRAFVRAAREA